MKNQKTRVISIILILVLSIMFSSTIWYVTYGSTTEINLGTDVKGTFNSVNGELTVTSTSSSPETITTKFSTLSNKSSIKIINFENEVYLPADSNNFFQELQNLNTIKNAANLNTSNVTSMSAMFWLCKSLTSIDLRGWDTSKVTNMHMMFDGCTSLINANLENLNTSNVTNMEEMFNECIVLTNVNLRGINTSNVTNMKSMFNGCESLTSLDLNSFDTSIVTNMESMFNGCKVLRNLDLSTFNTNNVTTMENMFKDCSALTNLNIGNFNTSNVTNMKMLFNNCSSLTSLNLTNFNTMKVTNMGFMFENCTSLRSIDLSSFNTSKVTTMETMFKNCTSLTSLDLSSFDMSKATTDYAFGNMLENCNALDNIYLPRYIKLLQLPAKYANITDTTDKTVYNYLSAKTFGTITHLTKAFEITYNCNAWLGTYTTFKQIKYLGESVQLKGDEFGSSSNKMTLNSWNTSADFSGTKYNQGDTYSIDSDLTLYAEWKMVVTLNNQNATTPGTQSLTVIYNSTLPQITIPTKTNYKFEGYYTEISGAGTQYYNSVGVGLSKWDKIENTTLYAKWAGNEYNVRLNTNGGIVNSGNITKYTYGTVTILPTNVTRDGYTFAGWYDNSSLTGTKITSISRTDSGNKTYYAKWEQGKFTVTFKDGTERTDIKTVVSGQSATPPNWTKPGYTLSWDKPFTNVTSNITVNAVWTPNTNTPYKIVHHFRNLDTEVEGYNEEEEPKTGTTATTVTAEYKEREGFTKNEADTRTVKQGLIAGDGSLVLHLYYNRNTYNITYELNGGTENGLLTRTYIYGREMVLQTNKVAKEGYRFTGWYDNEGLTGSPVTSIPATETGDKTFYAKWIDAEQEYYILSESYSIDLVENTIIKVSPETTVTDFLSKIETNGQKKVINAQGQEITTTSLVGTGYKLQVTFKGQTYTYEIAVRGDLDGNGKITTTDLSIINQQILHKIELTGIKAKAADCDFNGRLSTTDLSMINQAVLRKITL